MDGMHKMTLRNIDNTFTVHITYFSCCFSTTASSSTQTERQAEWAAEREVEGRVRLDSLKDHELFTKSGDFTGSVEPRYLILIPGLQTRVVIGKLFSLFAINSICCVYSKDGSFERPKHIVFKLMDKKIITFFS